ncbi:MAG: DUF721 domain-containing protein [Paraprevotella sp.]|nr:DUF721 domain-containing protein [Paraprevotella sp.]
MKRKQAELLGLLIRQYCRQEGLETPLNEYRICKAWTEVMGEAINRYTRETTVRNQTLYVKLSSPALKTNLMMSREILVRRLNEHVGAQVIQNIVFY